MHAADLPVSALMWQRHAFARASLGRQHELAERAVAVDRFTHVAKIVAGIPEGNSAVNSVIRSAAHGTSASD